MKFYASRWLTDGTREDFSEPIENDEQFMVTGWLNLGQLARPGVAVIASYIGAQPYDFIARSPKTEAFL